MPHQTIPDKRQSLVPDRLADAKRVVGQEMPDVADAPVDQFGFWNRIVSLLSSKLRGTPDDAQTSPSGEVAFNPDYVAKHSQPEIEDTLAHELTHVRQNRRGDAPPNISEPYYQRPRELEAFQTAADRAVRQGRPASTERPSFETGRPQIGDIRLPGPPVPALMKGSTPDVIQSNIQTLIRRGWGEEAATKRALMMSKRGSE